MTERILITGASSGIGAKTAELLSDRYSLLLHGNKNKSQLEKLQSKCGKEHLHIPWLYDLSNRSNLENELSSLVMQNGFSIDHFVHIAGVCPVQKFSSMKRETVEDTFAINVLSAIEIIQILKKKKINGNNLKTITMISSISSEYGAKGYSIYSASKAALNGLMKALSIEFAPEIRVNTILPGGISSSGNRQLYLNPEFHQKEEQKYPLGIGKPSDIASFIEYLISDKARWITGQKFTIDGGITTKI